MEEPIINDRLGNEPEPPARFEAGESFHGLRPKLNAQVDALNRMLKGVGAPSQPIRAPLPLTPKLYHAHQTTSGADTTCKAKLVHTDGTYGAVETMPKAKGYAVVSGAKCIFAKSNAGVNVLVPIIPQKYMYFQQGQDEDEVAYAFPATGNDWFLTHVRHSNYHLTEIQIWSTSGQYQVQMKVNGSLVGDVVNDGSTYPYSFDPPLEYGKDEPITLHVVSGQDVAGFEAIITMVERE